MISNLEFSGAGIIWQLQQRLSEPLIQCYSDWNYSNTILRGNFLTGNRLEMETCDDYDTNGTFGKHIFVRADYPHIPDEKYNIIHLRLQKYNNSWDCFEGSISAQHIKLPGNNYLDIYFRSSHINPLGSDFGDIHGNDNYSQQIADMLSK